MKLNKINLSGVSYDLQDYEASQALSGKQDTLISGTNLKTVNSQSLLGEGNIEIQGGGASYSAGTNISIGANNAINCTLNLANGGASRSIKNDTASTISSDAQKGAAFGVKLEIINYGEVAVGSANKRLKQNNSFGPSGNTEFTVGNGFSSTRHNAFEVRQNGDIYFPDTDNTTYQNFYEKPMVRLQDMYGELGNKLETSAITSAITSASTDSQVPSAKAVYDALQESGGGTVDTELDDTSENPVQNKVIYQKFDEVEEVTAAALNALNDKMGDVETLLASI